MQENKKIERYADWLDTKFRVPGTNITFGLDFIIGLFPVIGDIISLGLSGGLLMLMVGRGASGRALSLMVVNIALDAILGSLPFVGDIFDLFFKANRRNLNLYQDHFEDNEHQGSAWPVIVSVLIVIIAVIILVAWLIIKMLGITYRWIIS